MDDQKIKATELLAASILAIVKEKKLFFLLASFISVITMIFMWPTLDWYILLLDKFPEGIEGVMPELEAMIEEDLPYLYLIIAPSLLISLGVIVLWTRAVTGGTGAALAGGFRTLLIRILWVFWRYLGSLAIMMVGGGLVLLPLTLFGSVDATLAVILFLVLYIIFLFLMFAVMFLLSVSVHAEAWDIRMPIHKSYLYLKGNVLRGTGVLLLGLLGIYVIQSMAMVMLIGLITSGNSIAVAFAFFIIFFIASLMNFMWAGYGAFYARKLVPELQK